MLNISKIEISLNTSKNKLTCNYMVEYRANIRVRPDYKISMTTVNGTIRELRETVCIGIKDEIIYIRILFQFN